MDAMPHWLPGAPSGRFSIVSVMPWCATFSFATEPSFAARSGNMRLPVAIDVCSAGSVRVPKYQPPPRATTPHTPNSTTVLGFIFVPPSGPSAGAPAGLHDAHDDGEDRQQGRHQHDG